MKKIGIICLALVFALGALGVGFATWSGVLNITGTATTGTFGAELSQPSDCTDSEDGLQDIGECSCEIVGDTIVITVTNGYPCYTCTCYFDVHSTGTIPIKITGITPGNDNPTVATVTCGDDPNKGDNTVGDCGAEGDVLVGEKIHYCEEAWGVVTVHFEQFTPPPTVTEVAVFTCTIDYEQAQ